MKINRNIDILSDNLIYSARLIIIMQKSAYKKISIRDYCRRLLQKTIAEDYALIEYSI